MILGVSGHRPQHLGGYSKAADKSLIKFANKALLAYDTQVEVVSGCALGWDTACALAALDQGHWLHMVIPFEGFNAKWPKHSQARFEMLCNAAMTVRVSNPDSGALSVIESGNDNFRSVAVSLMQRNKHVVDLSDEILALFSGASGGTAHCVDYARSVGKPVNNVFHRWLMHKERGR